MVSNKVFLVYLKELFSIFKLNFIETRDFVIYLFINYSIRLNINIDCKIKYLS